MSRRIATASGRRRQRGVVMFVALIVMVVMALAALALIRSVDTTTSVVGNLGFRQASILPANAAVEEAVAALFEKKLVDLTKNNPAQNYFAAKQADEDSRGIPKQLQKKLNFKLTRILSPGGDNEVRYVIERMCQAEGPVAPAGLEWYPLNCDMLKPKIGGTTTTEEALTANPYPFYRLTIRVDGPRNTASFVQVMLR
jgi:Tfp pilus assembly protein PilX